MKDNISIPRGTADVLYPESYLWQIIEEKSRKIFKIYNYKEIRTPIFENTNLFKRSLGQTSDVVNKQLLELLSQNKNGHEQLSLSGLSLRPEGTAPAVRSYIQNRIDKKEGISKLYYIGPMFRGERPQKGRLRQFNQIGAEVLGVNTCSPYIDAEVIALCVNLIKDFGIKDFELKINTLGSDEDRKYFSKYLRKKLDSKKCNLCEDCKNRFERNVFRVLDCKNKNCKSIIFSLKLDNSFLSAESRRYYSKVKELLVSLNIPYTESLNLVRGLDYYTHTVFEILCKSLGSQDAIGAGGRYNNLVKQLGGPDVDAMGFALGFERILLAGKSEQNSYISFPNVYCIAMDEKSFLRVFNILDLLRKSGISSDMNHKISSMKSLMRSADKSGAGVVLIIGENELKRNSIIVKDMRKSEQEEIFIKDDNITVLIDAIRKRAD